MSKDHYAVLMAGGVGSRCWPVSTAAFPKQFHDMLGTGQTLLQRTFDRLSKVIPKDQIFILTNEAYERLVVDQLSEVTPRQLVLEPAMRNTAPCILYAALKIQKENPNASMIVAPSDHWIEDEDSFVENVETAFEVCSASNSMITLGIRPTFPNTGYGYIQYEEKDNTELKEVLRFTEKPSYGRAKHFIEEGNYLWNAGIFLWSAKTIIKAFKEFQPVMSQLLANGLDALNTSHENAFIEENYAKAENISIDYAILEHARNIFVIPARFDWNDLGTWGSLFEKLPKDARNNAIVGGQTLLEDASGNMIRTKKEKVVVVKGIDDHIIVDTDEVLLIYPKDREQEIKKVRSRVGEAFGDTLI